MSELAATEFEVVILGGSLRRNFLFVVGPLTEEMLREFHADLLIIGVDGFAERIGLATPNILESRLNRAMIHAADKVVAVFDSTTFNRKSHSFVWRKLKSPTVSMRQGTLIVADYQTVRCALAIAC